MKLEDQVCTLQQAKRLKEFGVSQESYFLYGENAGRIVEQWSVEGYEDNFYSAFTVAELGLLLPDYLRSIGNLEIGKCETDHVSMKRMETSWWNVSYWNWDVLETPRGDTYLKQKSNHLHQAPTLAQAMADMLIFLMENEFIS